MEHNFSKVQNEIFSNSNFLSKVKFVSIAEVILQESSKSMGTNYVFPILNDEIPFVLSINKSILEKTPLIFLLN